MFLSKYAKSPFFQLVYFVDGRRTKISTKTSNRKEAEKFLKRFIPAKPKIEIQNKEIPNADTTNINLFSFADEYIDYSKQKFSKSYLKGSIKPAFKFLKGYAGNIPLNKIDVKLVDTFISFTEKRSISGASLYYRTLKAAFSKAVLWNYINENPFKKIKAPKDIELFPIFINIEELQIIISNEADLIRQNIYSTAFYTGMRLGEILNMKWSWIDFNNNIITVKCYSDFKTKSRKERIIPINPILKNILQNISPVVINLDQNSFVFQKVFGIKLNVDFVSKRFKKAVRKSKLNDGIHFHSLRHSFASNLAQKGVSLYVLKELLGHKNIKTTQIYAHLQNENLAAAVNLL